MEVWITRTRLIFYFIYVIVSQISAVIAWYLVGLKTPDLIKRTSYTFIISCVIFCITTAIINTTSNPIYRSISLYKIINSVILPLFIHVQIAGFIIAYFHYTASVATSTKLSTIEKEKEILQLKILHKNLEPHFLFNNLNVLSGLAIKSPEKVTEFIKIFSHVYKYYLDYEKKYLSPISEEIEFIEKYMELIQQRFGSIYRIKNKITNMQGAIVPCTLQLCVENAIKHNKASKEYPLVIKIYRTNTHIKIINRINKVDFTIETSTGNKYLKQQYKVNFDKEIRFKQVYSSYVVEIPIF